MASGRNPARWRRGQRVVAVSLITGVLVVLSAPIALAACALTDLTCLAGSLQEPSADQAGPTEQATDPVGGAVDGVVDDAEDAVAPIVDKAEDTIDGVLGSGGGPVPIDPPPIGPPRPAGDPGPGRGPGPNPKDAPGAGTGPLGPGVGATTPSVTGGGTAAPIANRPVRDLPGGSGLLHRVGGVIGQTAQTLGFPLVLVAIVIGFLVIQNRIDRKDPKLSLAPIQPDTLRFA